MMIDLQSSLFIFIHRNHLQFPSLIVVRVGTRKQDRKQRRSKMIASRRSSERLDATTHNQKRNRQRDLQEIPSIKLAGIVDTTNYAWAETLFAVTIKLLNDPNNGFFDNLSAPLPPISYEVLDGGCDGYTALASYWLVQPVHALIGARCTGASIPLAWMGALENVPQISMASTSARL